MVLHFRDKHVINATRLTLIELVRVCSAFEDGQVISTSSTGVFLAAFLISLHPTTIFEGVALENTSLKEASDKLTLQFSSIVNALINDSGIHTFLELSQNFCANFKDYQTKFMIWKRIDEVRLVSRLNTSLRRLLGTMLTLAGQSLDVDIIHQGNDPMILQIKGQIMLIREQLQKIGFHPQVVAFDALMAHELETYRLIRTLREEQLRQEEPSGFDFIE
jgi:hypothetical protein